MNKKLLFSVLAIAFAGTLSAQMVGTDAYLKGNYVELGIDGGGGFEGASTTASPPPAGMHFRSGNPFFGFVSNPQMDGWVNYDGDFFTPGTPENGWGFEIGNTGGPAGRNNCAFLLEMPGTITSWNYSAPTTTCDWEGDYMTGTNVHFKVSYTLNDNDLFYITTISVTNNTAAPINDFYYFRNIDPDNNESISADFTTQNTVVSQITMGGANTTVSATQSTPWTSDYELVAVDSNWIGGYGGFSNRDASDLYNLVSGFTGTVGSTNYADEAVFLAHKISVLSPGTTMTFKFASVFDPSAVSAAISEMNGLTTGVPDVNADPVSIYPNPFTESTTISIDKSIQLKNASLHIYDVTGREISVVNNIADHQVKVEKNTLSAGAYIYRLINDGGITGTGKLIVK
ncbi:MAG: T9SS type A sorting domain-containing protein [Bacteroidia bacterium]